MAKRLKTLLLEDRPTDAELILHELRRAGYEPEWTRVETEPDYLAQLGQGWEIILADYVLPGFDGLRALALLRERGFDIPFIIVSGTIGEEKAVQAMKDGATDYLIKDRLARLGQAVERGLHEVALRRERKRAETELRMANRALRLISLFNQEMVRATDEMAFLQAACRIAVEQGGYRLAWIGFAEQDQAKSVRPMAQCGFETGYLETVKITWADAERGRGPTGTAIRTGQPVIARHLATDPAFGPWREAALQHGLASSVALPLHGEGRCYGALNLYAAEPDAFDAGELDLLGELANDLAYGISALRHRTERKRAEETLRKREGDLQLAQQIGHIGSWESDPVAGTLVWSEEVYRIFGCNPAAFVPTREAFIQLVHAEDRARVREAVAESIRNGADYELEHRIRRADGTERVVHERGCFLWDASGKAGRLVGTVQDITERKKLETQFLRAQRMEAVGALAGGIAHDLNNILAPILMGAPMLRQLQTPSETASTLDAIESSAQRGAAVVRQLLTFSRGQSGQRISFHLDHLLHDLRHIIRETFPKDIHFTSSEAPDLWPLVADPTQLHQVLLNLCVNARDAMPEGGTLAVTAANFQADDSFASMAPGARPGVYVLLQVSDTGAGIRPEHLDKIFDPFFTTKEVGRGTGLGLAVVQRVVTGHGGFVRVRSQVGQGTTFAVYLPASPEAAAPATPASPSALLDGQGQLILMVDDEEPVRLVTQQTLVHHGYAVVTASDGAEAVAVFTRHRHQIKAALVDLVMPGMNGLDLVKVLARMAPALPVLLSTGAGSDPAQSEKLAALRGLGVHVFLDKPYTTHELLKALHAVLSREGKHE